MKTRALVWLLLAGGVRALPRPNLRGLGVDDAALEFAGGADEIKKGDGALEEIDGRSLVTGSPFEDVAGTLGRRRLLGDGWGQLDKVTAYNGFGHSVALSDGVLAVGDFVEGYDDGSLYMDDDYPATGSVFVYDAGDVPVELNRLGYSVALADNVLAIGVPYNPETQESDTGKVYVYDLSDEDSASWSTTEKQLTTTYGRLKGDLFGYSLALSGGVLAVGAPYDEGEGRDGSVYLYDVSSGSSSWPSYETKQLEGGRRFGQSVALSGSVLAVGGDGEAYVFERSSSGMWPNRETKKFPGTADGFGHSVALSGGILAVGVPRDDDKGSVYVFRKSGSFWPSSETKKLTARDGAAFDQFGHSVALADGFLAVGAPQYDNPDIGSNSGAVYVFDLRDPSWWSWPSKETKLTDIDGRSYDQFGYSVALADGALAVGTYNPERKGSVFIYGSCQPGYYSDGAGKCKQCEAGKNSDAGGATMCTPCLAGQTSNSGSYKNKNVAHTECVNCAAGSFSNGDGICVDCDPGEFSAAGAGSCTLCGRGTYSTGGQADECKNCGDPGYAGYDPTLWDPDQRGAGSTDECRCAAGLTGTNCDQEPCDPTTPVVSLGFLVLEVQWPRFVRELSRNEDFVGIAAAFRSYDIDGNNRLSVAEARRAIRAGGMAVPLEVSHIWSRDGEELDEGAVTITEMIEDELARLEEQKTKEYYERPDGSGEITAMEATFPNDHDGDAWSNEICEAQSTRPRARNRRSSRGRSTATTRTSLSSASSSTARRSPERTRDWTKLSQTAAPATTIRPEPAQTVPTTFNSRLNTR